MDFTGLYNAIMQLIFIITGLVSIKSLTEMITQLVGQGDALKDGADTGKDVKKLAGQATGAAVHGAKLAQAGVKATAGVAGRVASSPWAKKVGSAGSKLSEKAGEKWDKYVQDSVDSKGVDHKHWVGRRALNHRDRKANADMYVKQRQRVNDYSTKEQEYSQMARDYLLAGDTAKAHWAQSQADLYEQKKSDAKNVMKGMRKAPKAHWYSAGMSGGVAGRMRSGAHALQSDGQWLVNEHKRGIRNATGFEDGVGIKAMLKGDKEKDTAINQFFHGNYKLDKSGNIETDKNGNRKREENNFATTVNNANKFVFNITGAKGGVKDFLDNADVLDAIEKGDTALSKQMQRVIAQTGAKSDAAKASRAARDQARANAEEMEAQTKAMNATMEGIQKALEDIKNRMP